jgi:hypothetical protein
MTLPSRRSLVIVAALCVLALLMSAAVDRERAAQLASRERIAAALVELGRAAGLRDEGGNATLRPLPVAANLEGGPLWLHAELTAALEADAAFELADSPHLVRMEVVGSEHAFGLATALYRQGWNLRLPHPVRIRIAPWLATITAVLGVAVTLALRRAGWGLLVAGIAAQRRGPRPCARGRSAPPCSGGRARCRTPASPSAPVSSCCARSWCSSITSDRRRGAVCSSCAAWPAWQDCCSGSRQPCATAAWSAGLRRGPAQPASWYSLPRG